MPLRASPHFSATIGMCLLSVVVHVELGALGPGVLHGDPDHRGVLLAFRDRSNRARTTIRNVPFISVANVPRTPLNCGTECNEALWDVARGDERAGQTAAGPTSGGTGGCCSSSSGSRASRPWPASTSRTSTPTSSTRGHAGRHRLHLADGRLHAGRHRRPADLHRPGRSTSPPRWPWASAGTCATASSTGSPASRPGRSTASAPRRSSPGSPTTSSRSRCWS